MGREFGTVPRSEGDNRLPQSGQATAKSGGSTHRRSGCTTGGGVPGLVSDSSLRMNGRLGVPQRSFTRCLPHCRVGRNDRCVTLNRQRREQQQQRRSFRWRPSR